jgi:hypothetical protein
MASANCAVGESQSVITKTPSRHHDHTYSRTCALPGSSGKQRNRRDAIGDASAQRHDDRHACAEREDVACTDDADVDDADTGDVGELLLLDVAGLPNIVSTDANAPKMACDARDDALRAIGVVWGDVDASVGALAADDA